MGQISWEMAQNLPKLCASVIFSASSLLFQLAVVSVAENGQKFWGSEISFGPTDPTSGTASHAGSPLDQRRGLDGLRKPTYATNRYSYVVHKAYYS